MLNKEPKLDYLHHLIRQAFEMLKGVNIKDNIKATELLRELLFAAPLDTMPAEYLALLYKCADSEVDDAFRLRITAEIERRYNDKT